MQLPISLSQSELLNFLLHVAVVRPVFVWGSPGIGKSAIIEQFAAAVGLPCVSLLGSQLAPEDLMGVPMIVDSVSKFCPPAMIARSEPYCLFLDELNACSQDVQKAFYSLINEKRVGDFQLPAGSIVIGAGNRAQDAAIVKQMSSALINRMVHVQLRVDHGDWLAWAHEAGIHPWILEYIQTRPDHLCDVPSKAEEPFSTPRAWHILSEAIKSFGDNIPEKQLAALLYGSLTFAHASQFKAFLKQLRNRYGVDELIKGDKKWPTEPTDRDLLYFLAQSFRAHLIKDLPNERALCDNRKRELADRAKILLRNLASINLEIAQMVITGEGEDMLPPWFISDLVRAFPRLVAAKEKKA